MANNIYDDIMKECPENFVGYYCSDLYILCNETTKAIIERYYKMPTVMAVQFIDQTNGNLCYEIPFAYYPYYNIHL